MCFVLHHIGMETTMRAVIFNCYLTRNDSIIKCNDVYLTQKSKLIKVKQREREQRKLKNNPCPIESGL